MEDLPVRGIKAKVERGHEKARNPVFVEHAPVVAIALHTGTPLPYGDQKVVKRFGSNEIVVPNFRSVGHFDDGRLSWSDRALKCERRENSSDQGDDAGVARSDLTKTL